MNYIFVFVQVQLVWLVEGDWVVVSFMLDGCLVMVLEGDMVLIVVLINIVSLCCNEFSGQLCVGFCMMGVCQDCWIVIDSGECLCVCFIFICVGM